MLLRVGFMLAMIAAYAAPHFAAAQDRGDCGARWSTGFAAPTFFQGIPFDICLHVVTATVWDEPGGPAIWVGGNFLNAGGKAANWIARWDGRDWSSPTPALHSIQPDLSIPTVASLYVWNGEGALALYVSGAFDRAGPTTLRSLARWDGSEWSEVGGGIAGGATGEMESWDDGSGDALYVIGGFTAVGDPPVSASQIARWNGSEWSALGIGIGVQSNRYPFDIEAIASGPARGLYVGGSFLHAGGQPIAHIARWDGVQWHPVGSGLNGEVHRLAVTKQGSDPMLIAGGWFSFGPGPMVSGAIWDGVDWSPMPVSPQITGGQILHIIEADAGGKPEILMTGLFVDPHGYENIVRWNGTHLEPVETPAWIYGQNFDFCRLPITPAAVEFEDADGRAVYFFGRFISEAPRARGVLRWDGHLWSAFGQGVLDRTGTWPGSVTALANAQVGLQAAALYAGGSFGPAPFRSANLALFDGQVMQSRDLGWQTVGRFVGQTPSAPSIAAIRSYDDGCGPMLYAAGAFSECLETQGASRIARWDGSVWSAVGAGFSSSVLALEVFDADGAGAESSVLVAGGAFVGSAALTVNRIAEWDGSAWHGMADGFNGLVRSLVAVDLGGAPSLVAGGDFTASGLIPVSRISYWNGHSWQAMGAGFNGPVRALAVFDETGEKALYAGGDFSMSGETSVAYLARWNGTDWQPADAAMPGPVTCLSLHDPDGTGPNQPLLIIGGFRGTTQFSPYLLAWDGSAVTSFGSSVSRENLQGIAPGIFAIAESDETGRPSLFVGGDIKSAGGHASVGIAKWFNPDLPEILGQPHHAAVDFGAPAQFTVKPGENGPFTYRWRKDGIDLSDTRSIMGADTPTLQIDAVMPEDLGDYTVAVTNSCGTTYSTRAALSEFVPPTFCAGDANNDGVVNFDDVLSILANWGATGPGLDVPGDSDRDGSVDCGDVFSTLSNWGQVCPEGTRRRNRCGGTNPAQEE